MNSKVVVIIVVIAVIAIIAVGAVAYSFLREPEAATGPIEAIPIASTVEEPAATDQPESAEPTSVAQPTTVAQQATPTMAPETPVQTEAPKDTAQPTTDAVVPTETSPPNEGSSTTRGIFEINPAGSEARFLIDEVLRGDPKTVVGSTDQVAGQLAVDPGDLSTAQVGVIQVNARTLTTDNQFRNRAIKNRILLTDQHEFVTFTPTEVVGLTGPATVGETYAFQVVGDLTITDVTRQVSFDVTVTPVSETRLEGMATTAFLYTDFELAIPDAQAVDTVEDEVRLEFEFVAKAVQ